MSSFSRGTAILFLLGLLVPCTGCLKMEHDLRIAHDGSVIYKLEYSITENAVVQLKAMEKLRDELAKAGGNEITEADTDPMFAAFLDPSADEIRDKIKPFEAKGVTIKKLKVETKSGWRHVALELVAANLAEVADTDFFREHGFNLEKGKEAGQFVFSRDAHIGAAGKIAPGLSKKEEKELIPILSGFNTTVKVTVPGRILNSTAFQTTLYTATWSFDFNREPNALMAVQMQPFRIVFESTKVDPPAVTYKGTKYPAGS